MWGHDLKVVFTLAAVGVVAVGSAALYYGGSFVLDRVNPPEREFACLVPTVHPHAADRPGILCNITFNNVHPEPAKCLEDALEYNGTGDHNISALCSEWVIKVFDGDEWCMLQCSDWATKFKDVQELFDAGVPTEYYEEQYE